MNSLFLVLSLIGGVLNLNWTSDEIPRIIETPLGDRILLTDAVGMGTPGAPLLPILPLTAVLPEGAIVDSLRILSVESFHLSNDFHPMPAQMGVPSSRPEDFIITDADPEAFSECVDFSVKLAGQGILMGYPVIDIVLNPVSWNPTTGQIDWAQNISFQLYYHIGDHVTRIPARGIVGNALAHGIISSSVINQLDIPIAVSAPITDLPWGEYLIIADDDLATAFEPLAQWKTQKGIPAKIVTMSYITSTYVGVDDSQKLRFFLYDIYQDSPPTYILLAGDTPGIPHRNCYATAEGYIDNPSSDLYYQDMNDTAPGVDAWNLDGDDTWGELNGDDLMDYHPDYVLGRASVESVSEAEIFVEKVLAWESCPDSTDWYTSMGFTTEIMWTSPYCPGSVGKEKVDSLYTLPTWSITKLYESTGTQSYSATMSMLNTGMQFVNHAGHGSYLSVSIGPGGYLMTYALMTLTNISMNGRPSIWNTVACLSGYFDNAEVCLAEAWLRSPGGGGFCIMNTRYSWLEPAEPGDQWSELVDQEFFSNFFIEDMYQLGVAFMMAKDDFTPLIPSDNHYDWIAKSNTLFGDPELPMYTTVPDSIEIGEIFLYEGLSSITVNLTSSGYPLEDARVCLLQGEWDDPVTYAVGLTDALGEVTLTWPGYMPAIPAEARITVSARDHVLLTGLHTVYNMGISSEFEHSVPYLSLSSNPVRRTAAITWLLPESLNGELDIIDMSGRSVARHILQGSEGIYLWQAHENPAGIYFVRMITNDGHVLNTPMVVIR